MGEGIIKCHLSLPHTHVSDILLPACPKKNVIRIRYKCVNAYKMIRVTIDLNIMYRTSEEATDQLLEGRQRKLQEEEVPTGSSRMHRS